MEYNVTMKYVHEAIDAVAAGRQPGQIRILDEGAATGAYSIPLAKEGYDVTSIELVQHNLGRLKQHATEENVTVNAYKGNAVKLKREAADSFDIVLVFGPMYHLTDRDDKLRVLAEARRVLKPDGRILVAYVMNEYAVVSYAFKEHNALECMKDGRLDGDFNTISLKDDLYSYVRIEEINALNKESGLTREKIISPDGAADYMRTYLNEMSDEEFSLFLEYQKKVCERQDLIGAGSHTVDILRK